MILIVEDDEQINHLFQVNLEKRGYQTDAAFSGTQALAIIEKTPPSLMLLDIKLPGLTGWELLRVLQQRQLATFPVIVVTASVYPTDHKMREFPQIKQFMFKPVEMQELVDAVSAHLKN